MKPWVVVLLLSVGVLVPAHASAFRTLAEEPDFVDARGQVIGWTRWPIGLAVYSQPQDLVDGPGTLRALQEAVHVWNQSQCASGALEALGMTSAPAALGDGRNTVQWVHAGWEKYGPNGAVAITENRYQVKAGHYSLIEADIYLNAATMRSWTSDMLTNLDGVLAHELGHVLGLAHPCERNGAGGAPACGAEPTSLMHPEYDPRQFALTQDDDQGVCYIYPDAAPRPEVAAESACAVSATGGAKSRVTWSAWICAMVALVLWVRRARSLA